ncbi:toll/interleukin-1 receptor domain-containing protein [Bacillus cereus]|uniref:toll/interleukin-1 receptor domain-containing protein n=1 Tax=Bacillus cereus TaxID=1396 RepID=UPI0024BC02D8|nr:toll/interleukin-1 receptor domain-containing protein [Bacillus cereus]
MGTVFLSHSSKDKSIYIRHLAEKLINHLGKHRVVYDERTFEKGMKSIEEIDKGLMKSELFVIFLSRSSLEDSDWVKYELNTAYEMLKDGDIKRIYPIIIDEEITYKHPNIPQWMKDDYNVQYVGRPSKAFSLIKQRLIEISWELYPKLKEKRNIFVGRNDLTQTFEERKYSFEPLTCIIASGIEKIGRKSFIEYCAKKTKIITDVYEPPIISIDSHQTIEDFIYSLYGLGFSKEMDITNLMSTFLEEKIELAIELIKDIKENDEIIFIRDDGGLIMFDGKFKKWFSEILDRLSNAESVIFMIAPNFRLNHRELLKHPGVFHTHVEELSAAERSGLFQQYLAFNDIKLTREQTSNFIYLLKGYPEQVFFAVDMIKNEGVNHAWKNSADIIEFNSEKTTLLLKKFENDEKILDFLFLLAQFDTVSFSLVLETVPENEKDYYEDLLSRLLISGLCEYEGSDKEYVRLISPISDFLQRSERKLNPQFQTNLDIALKKVLEESDFNEKEIPDFLYAIKTQFQKGAKIDTKYLIPSHFLKIMIDLYEKKRNYPDVIRFAYKALENEEFIDTQLVHEIRYFLCLALAKQKKPKFFEEIQNINGADHNFLFGFYYRQIGNNEKALEQLKKSLEIRPNFNRARRELVQVHINLEEYEKAKNLAQEYFENDKTNPYFIQAYFTAILKSDKSRLELDKLEELIQYLEKIKTDKASEMVYRCKAQIAAFYKNDRDLAFQYIEAAIHIIPNLIYAKLIKLDICLEFNELTLMRDVLNEINQYHKKRYDISVLTKYELLYLLKSKGKEKAKGYLCNLQGEIGTKKYQKLSNMLEV